MDRLARIALFTAIAFPMAAALASGCSEDANSTAGSTQSSGTAASGSASSAAGGAGGEGTGGSGTSSAGGNGASSTGAGGTPVPTEIATCQGKTYQCGDLIDNDMDGLLDSQDPDCLGPCDNTENSFYGGIPGQAGPACTIDCYFDSDSGSGNDDCHWNHKCDPNEVAPDYYPEPENGVACVHDENANTPGTDKSCAELDQTQSQTCHDICDPLTPNGCDCFGCCELPPGSDKFVFLGSVDAKTGLPSCKLADLGDPTKCHPCKPVQACLNTCGTCELCVGKDSLPPECFPSGAGGAGGAGQGGAGQGGGGSMQCPSGVQACGLPGQAPCPPNYYCITGCCQAVPG